MNDEPARQQSAVTALVESEATRHNRSHVISAQERIASGLFRVRYRIAGLESDKLHAPAVRIKHLRAASHVMRIFGVTTQGIGKADIRSALRNTR